MHHQSLGEALWIYAALFAAVGLLYALVRYFSQPARIHRALQRVPRCLVADAVAGTVVRIAGKVELVGAPLTAPLSGRRCAYYEVMVERFHVAGRTTPGYWEILVHETLGGDFAVRDASGRALVRLQAADLALVIDHERGSNSFHEATPTSRRSSPPAATRAGARGRARRSATARA